MQPLNTDKSVKFARTEQSPIIVHALLSGSATVWLLKFASKCRIVKGDVRWGTVANSVAITITKATVNNYSKLPDNGAVAVASLPDTTNQYAAVASSAMYKTPTTSSSSKTLVNLDADTNYSLVDAAAGEPIIEENEVLVVQLPTDATLTTLEMMITALPVA